MDDKSSNEMRNTIDSSTGNFVIHINLKSINTRTYVKDLLKQKHLDFYKNKLNVKCRSRVLPPSEDYLWGLTTKELDSYVNLETNRAIHTSLEVKASPHKHTNVYRPGFLSKVNRRVKREIQTQSVVPKEVNVGRMFRNKRPLPSRRYSSVSDDFPEAEMVPDGELDSFDPKKIKTRRRFEEDKKVYWHEGLSKSLIRSERVPPPSVFRGMDIQKRMLKSNNSRFKTCYD